MACLNNDDHNRLTLQSLFIACSTGDFDILNIFEENNLIDHFINNNINGYTPLMVACNYEKITVIEKLLKYNVDVNKQDNNGHTVLMKMCYKSENETNKKIIKLLLDNEANIHQTDNEQWTTFMHACYTLNTYIINMLLAYNVNVNYKTDSIIKPACGLMILCNSNNHQKKDEIINTIIKHCNKRTIMRGFHVSCAVGYIKMVDYAILNNYDLHEKQPNGYTPFTTSVRYNQCNVIQKILENDCMIEQQQIKHAIILASKCHHFHLIDVFLNYIKDYNLIPEKFSF